MRLKYRILGLFHKEQTLRKCHKVLLKWNPYYRGLSHKKKRVFQIRTLHFVRSTTFTGDKNLKVTPEMRVIISGGFVQLTLGFRKDVLDVFNHVHLSPKPYSYPHIDGTFKGDVNPHNHRVTLTWPFVKKGFEIPDDGMNLVLHEFAHCLVFENQRGGMFGSFIVADAMDRWWKHASQKMKRINNGERTLFRKYAGKSMLEMFAVGAEVFFEQPQELLRQEPELFKSLCHVYNQDPRKRANPVLN